MISLFKKKSRYNDIELSTWKVVLKNSCEVKFCKFRKLYEVNEMHESFKNILFFKHTKKIKKLKNYDKKPQWLFEEK